jgi:hypothetical protein
MDQKGGDDPADVVSERTLVAANVAQTDSGQ